MPMNEKWELVGDYSVEIWFPVEKDNAGYPESKEWEQLLARPVLERDDFFQLESVPFYLKNVSCGDIIRADIVKNGEVQEDEFFQFAEVIDRGGHTTYRLLLREKHPKDPEFTTEELLKKGLAVEEQYGDFLAVDVPPTIDQTAIDDYLRGERRKGRWQLQDGYLNDPVVAHREKETR
jgi:Domain of unknown function (DUF4265)